jgi:intraflagellar transport protein 122
MDHDDMLCFSGRGSLSIKCGSFPAHQQKMQGFVVGFKGAKIFVLSQYAMTTVDVPQSGSMERFIGAKAFEKAYEVACLGVTDDDWRRLGAAAMESFSLAVAKKVQYKL